MLIYYYTVWYKGHIYLSINKRHKYVIYYALYLYEFIFMA